MEVNTSPAVADSGENPFCIRSANEWLATAGAQPPRRLFGNFWFEGELCILFADTNLGKSVLAVQIGESLASGRPIEPFDLEMPPCRVLYFDFEQVASQFNARYSSPQGAYAFSPNFFRAELDVMTDGSHNAESLCRFIEESVAANAPEVIIIDNLTYLSHERAKDALQLIKHLKMLKSKYGLSILALAHTPKRNPYKPLTQNDLQGSKMVINFCDSAFAIGHCRFNPEWRYLKQVKQRNSVLEYGADNVALFCLEKPADRVQFTFTDFSDEDDQLMQPEWDCAGELGDTILELHRRGYSQRRIESRLYISKSSVQRVLKAAGVNVPEAAKISQSLPQSFTEMILQLPGNSSVS